MVDAYQGFIWYSDETGVFGRLDPRLASGTSDFADWLTDVIKPVCYTDWQPDGSAHTVNSTASASWATGNYSVTVDADGWQLYQLPGTVAGKGPWGIRARGDGVWVIDRERQKLVHMPRTNLYIPYVTK
jgi:streptogramin lyase